MILKSNLKFVGKNFKVLVAFKGTGSSSKLWLERQRKDPYVKRAVKETYRARSAFKLLEINEKYNFIKPGDLVIDIGASPGSWSQLAVKLTNSDLRDLTKPQGKVISLDREFIYPIDGAHVLSYSDITLPETKLKIEKLLNGQKATSVISDMAPNSTGQSTFDHDAIIELQAKAFDMAKQFLDSKGFFLCKIWFGDGTSEFKEKLSKNFESVKSIKPPASRNQSAEIFIFCSNFKSKINIVKN
ncbi:rRNA methyltransferase mitochondrial [Brachionus plicatilis]|uniref:rRNA methyltransferase 2, mitochondrial n=1 Tax=Brachionus plicatilis TaxID=10195 RepID=A0A3M7T5Y7_BRAPC|nr:rRNA methyltransferase mitochondrial [Brachionus plicatilis]